MRRLATTAITLLLLLIFCLATTSDVVQADTIAYNDDVPEQYVPLSETLTFPQFDPMIGILTSVNISATSRITGSLTYRNPITQAINVNILVTGLQSLTLPNGSSLRSGATLADLTKTLAPEEEGAAPLRETFNVSDTVTDRGDLDAYIGAGEVEMPVGVSAEWDASGGNPNIAILLISLSDAAARLQYNFTVPEVTLQKLTNGFDADDPNGIDVPQIAADETVTWTYVVTNTGTISIPLASVVVSDSQSTIVPQFVPDSDDGDGLLAPDEAWIFQAISTAADLLDPAETADLTVVDGCGNLGTSIYGERATYENIGTVRIPGFTMTDPSHYCNPAQPGVAIQKATNGADADDPNGSDVPILEPGESIAWTYVVTNTGNVTFTENQLTVTDDILGVTPDLLLESDDGDGLLSPSETWIYQATGLAADLLDPSQILNLTVVSGCDEEGTSLFGERATYENIGTVRVPGDSDSDPGHYCNPAQPGIVIEKATNGADADLPNDADVPVILPGDLVRWTYVVTNTGNVTFTAAQVAVSDDIVGIDPVLDVVSDDGDGRLTPQESWTYVALSNAVDLTDPAQTAFLTIVDGCRLAGQATTTPRPTYENRGSVAVPGAADSDYSHYCNPLAPTSIDLVRFVAMSQADSIQVIWEVAMERDTAGYHLLRSTGHRVEATRINSSLIPASSERASADHPLRYSFVDEMVVEGVAYAYWLQEVEENGAIAEYGPIYSSIQDSRFSHRVFMPMVID